METREGIMNLVTLLPVVFSRRVHQSILECLIVIKNKHVVVPDFD